NRCLLHLLQRCRRRAFHRRGQRNSISPRSVPRRTRTSRDRPQEYPRLAGECHVHADISPSALVDTVRANEGAELYVHPECGCTTSALWMAESGEIPGNNTHILSTGGMLEEAKKTTSERVLVATEIGMLHQLRKANPATEFLPVNPQAACPYMQMITAEKLLACLRDGTDEIFVDEQTAAAARSAVERMIAIGNP